MKRYKKNIHLVLLRTLNREDVDDDFSEKERVVFTSTSWDETSKWMDVNQSMESKPTDPTDNGDHWLHIEEFIRITIPRGSKYNGIVYK